MFCAMCPAYHECSIHKPDIEYDELDSIIKFYFCNPKRGFSKLED